MVKYINNGLTLMHDIPETLAPLTGLLGKREVPLQIIFHPGSPCNTVSVRYRVDGDHIEKLQAIPRKTNDHTGHQIFDAFFPNLTPGQIVEYVVTGNCVGCQVPGFAQTNEFPHSFRVTDPDATTPPQSDQPTTIPPTTTGPARFPIKENFVARASIQIETPRIIGPTPDGIRVTWNAMSGNVVGPNLSAKLLQGADWMQIRTDGIANVDVRAILETLEGGRIMLSYSGIIELGEDGFQKFLNKNLPKSLRVWTTPVFLTAEPGYKWLNRFQCVSIGVVSLENWTYIYDIFALN